MPKLFIISGLLLITALGYSQASRKIGGEILNEEEKPIPGLVVTQLGKTSETLTDVDGRFELMVDNGPITYIRLAALDLVIYLQYSEKDEFRKVTLKDWKKIKKESKRVSKKWHRKMKALEKNS